MKKKNIIITPLLAVATLVGVSFVQAQWAGPTEAPPGGNIAAPLNTGASVQSKDGQLILSGGLTVDGEIDGHPYFYLNPGFEVKASNALFYGIEGNPTSGVYAGYINTSLFQTNNDAHLSVNNDSATVIGSVNDAADGTANGGQDLKLDVDGAVGADYYCDSNGENCFTATSGPDGAGGAALGVVAWGSINNDGTIRNAGTDNWQVSRSSKGFYQLQILGHTDLVVTPTSGTMGGFGDSKANVVLNDDGYFDNNLTKTSYNVRIDASGSGDPEDNHWYFIAHSKDVGGPVVADTDDLGMVAWGTVAQDGSILNAGSGNWNSERTGQEFTLSITETGGMIVMVQPAEGDVPPIVLVDGDGFFANGVEDNIYFKDTADNEIEPATFTFIAYKLN